MTTDITELARRVEHIISDMKLKHGDKDTYAPVMKWDEFLALVEALASEKRICATWRKTAEANSEKLEKAQQVDEELCKLLPPGVEYMDPPDGGDVTPLEGVRRMVADYRQRIAELESRTVKMPHRNLGHPKLFLLCPFPYYDAEDMEKALAAAGIRVEAE
ncbi:TPA: hypothetical protein N3Y94_002695 [Klebsiella quasipneumoniae]|nr:hypothetical protein [Klebsiella quasipneumoniae]